MVCIDTVICCWIDIIGASEVAAVTSAFVNHSHMDALSH